MASLRRTHVTQQRFYDAQRQADELRNSALRNVKADRVLAANATSDDRVEFKRFAKSMARQHEELQMVDEIEQTTRRREAAARRQQQEEKIAAAIEAQNRATLRDEKYRQQLRETAPELRDLEHKLRTGYQTKELKNQIAARELASSREAQLSRDTARELQRAAVEHEEEERQRAMQRQEQSRRYQQDLDGQLEEQEEKKRLAYEQFMKDKAMIDSAVRQVQAEDDAAEMDRLQKKMLTRAELDEFARLQQQKREEREEQMRREDELIERQRAELDGREAAVKAADGTKRAAMEALQQRLAETVRQQREEHEAMEDIRQELYEEELRQRDEQAAQDKIAKALRVKMEMQAERSTYLDMKARNAEREAVEEEEFRSAMLEKFARDDRLEQMNAQKRRMKSVQHRRDVEALIEERRKRREFELRQEEEHREAEREQETQRKTIIEEERQRMLREHAIKLLGYLPKGVLESKDVDMLGEDFQRMYRSARTEDDSDY